MFFNNEFMKLYEELSELIEVKEVTDFDVGSDTAFYHFYEDLADLVNSLKIKRIYSNKNEHASQLDVYADDNASYVCMTVGEEGKRRTTQNFGSRSFGLSFKNLTELCDRTPGYSFDAGESGKYSQFLAKTQYNLGRRGKPTLSSEDEKVNAFRDFELLAIGKLATGEYFISGGQGRNLSNHWSSKLFTDDRVYKTLRAWFMTNMDSKQLETSSDTAQPHIYYYFANNEIGQPRADHPEDTWEGHILNTVNQLNSHYIPRPDKLNSDTFKRAMDFGSFKAAPGVEFEEIIGVGPFRVTDSMGNVLMQMDMCQPGSKGGYPPPKLLTSLADQVGGESAYADFDNYTAGQQRSLETMPKVSRPTHLVLSKETADFIADLYNESEHRVYISGKKDFVFKPGDIESIILPASIKVAGNQVYNIKNLLNAIAYGVITDYTDKASFLAALKAAKVTGLKTRDMNDHVYNNLVMLVQLLTTDYDHVLVELISSEGQSVTTLNLKTAYAKSGAIDRLKRTENGKYVNDEAHLRYVPEDDIVDFNIMSQIEDIQEVDWDGVTSVIADIKALGGKARLGAETILVGRDHDNNKYVLFVDNAYKATGFLELPGGGLHDDNVSNESFRNIALQRLHFKCGIEASDIANLTDTGKGLLLAEKGEDGTKGVAKDSKITWPWSYYKLFTATYRPYIDAEDTDYSFDNRGLLITKAKGEEGYTSYLKWIPVDSLNYNRAILTRYSNVFSDITKLADKCC